MTITSGNPVATMDEFKNEVELVEKDWSPNEEKRLKFKLDCVLMSLLCLGLFALQMDKGNISNALTSTFTEDLGISTDDVNNGNQLQLAAIVVFEIPFNVVLSKVGGQVLLTSQSLAWGLVALFQAFITNKSSFYGTRFLLGAFEAGYLPGAMVVMSSFYTRSEIAMRMTILYSGNYLAAGVSSLVAAGVFELAGVRGLAGWQWLFIIDGLFTVLVTAAFFFFLPGSPKHTLPLCRIKAFDYFTERDRHILSQRIVLDDPNRKVVLSSISFREGCSILTNYAIWGHFCINIISLTPKGGLALYSPTIVKSLGFDTIRANALASVSNFGVIILAVGASWVSDKTRWRGPICLVCGLYSLVFAGAQFSLVTNQSKWLKYAIFMLLNSGNAVSQGINDAWLASNMADPKARCLGLALCVMGSNLGGIAGQQLFNSAGAPMYRSSFLAILCIYAASLLLVAGQMWIYVSKNRRMRTVGEETTTREDRYLHPEIRFEI